MQVWVGRGRGRFFLQSDPTGHYPGLNIGLSLSLFYNNYEIWILCLFSTCKRWNRIANDRSLWKHVDLMAYELDLKKMWKMIRNHFSEVLLSIHLKGPLHQGMYLVLIK